MLKGKCKIWQGLKDRDGYGIARANGKVARVHRVAFEVRLKRRLRLSEIVMHLCQNKACINFNHLKVGTVKENNKMARESFQSSLDRQIPGWRKLYGLQ